MAKRRSGPPPSASDSAARDRSGRAFAGLRAQLQAHARQRAVPAPARGDGKADSSAAASVTDAAQAQLEVDARLFRRSLADTRPLPAHGRVELAAVPPPPLPRRRRPEEEDDDELPLKHVSSDPLQEAYRDVMPLRDSGRIEVLLPPPALPRAGRGAPVPTRLGEGVRPDGLRLPAAVDALAPSELFQQLLADARPLRRGGSRVELQPAAPAPLPRQREQDEEAALTESLQAPLSIEDRLDMGLEDSFLRAGLPRRLLSDLRRGRWVLQGELDLHGLVREEARAAIAVFIAQSLQQGWRCVRIIHGKGHGSPGKHSILKQLSRGWLAQREEILAFCQASPQDGGSGALYVLLRAARGRKS